MAEKLNEVQIKGRAIMATMIPNGRYQAADVETANALVLEMIMSGECEKADGLRATGWLGNSSAVAQWGQKMGFLVKAEADRDAVAREVDRLKLAKAAKK